jgi:hypothetical protein
MVDQETAPYILHLRVEHRRLNAALGQIGGLLLDLDGTGAKYPPTQLVESLLELRWKLRHHFAEEEAGGCIEEAVSRCPSLSSDARVIEAQRPNLMKELDGVIQRVRCERPGTVEVAAMQRAFEQFAGTLQQHESAERRILQMGFGVNADLE